MCFLSFACEAIFAQFYDSDDEVRFYIFERAFGKVANHGDRYNARIFNFNGNKAVVTDTHSTNYDKILEDENYFEKRIYGPNKDIIHFNSNLSSYNTVVYEKYNQYGSPVKYFFTENGKYLEIVSPGNKQGERNNSHYKLVSKEKFIEYILAYVNKQNGSWR